jgi:SSS family solute:Na+ symporter
MVITVVVVYCIAMLVIGWAMSGRVKAAKDYFIAGKEIPWWLLMATSVATWFGAGFFTGMAGKGYELGVGGFMAAFGYAFWNMVWCLLMVKILSKASSLTIPEYIEDRYDQKTRIAFAVIQVIALTGITSLQYIGLARVLEALAGVPFAYGMIIGFVIITVYVMMGGMWAVVWTDFVQYGIMLIGVVILIILGLGKIGGFAGLSAALPSSHFNMWAAGSHQILAWFLVGLTMFINQASWQRAFSAKSEKDAVIGITGGSLVATVLFMCMILVGMVARVLLPGLVPDQAMATMSVELFPPLLSGIFIAAIISAIMSSADSFLLSGVSNVVSDIYVRLLNPTADDKKLIVVSRWVTFLIAFLAVFLAFALPDLVNLMAFANSVSVSGGFFPVMLAVYWPRVTTPAAFWSMVLGSATCIIWKILGAPFSIDPVIAGIVVNFVVIMAISFLTAPEYKKARLFADKNGFKVRIPELAEKDVPVDI